MSTLANLQAVQRNLRAVSLTVTLVGMAKDLSVVEYYAEHERYRCGYCKSTDTNYSHGMWAHKMTVHDYQDLIDRGWRRSGRYCYKPIMNVTCCPMYTIKCSALDFKLSKSQKKVLKRIHRYLSHGSSKADDMQWAGDGSGTREMHDVLDIPDLQQKVLRAERNTDCARVTSVDPSLAGQAVCSEPVATGGLHEDTTPDKVKVGEDTGDEQLTQGNTVTASGKSSEHGKTFRTGVGQDMNRPPCKKAKLMRIERKKQKLVSQGYSSEDVEKLLHDSKQQQCLQAKTLEDFLKESLPEKCAHKLEIHLVCSSPPSADFEKTSRQSHELYQKYQLAVHGDPPEKCSYHQYSRFLVTSPLQLVVVSVDSSEFIATLASSRELYAKYQVAIHKDTPEECNIQTFCEFLVDSPLKRWTPGDGPPQGYGSFHQQYWLDGKLVAVGVVDILPRCVSSVYFFYDPDLSHLSLGTFACLQELSLVRSLHWYAPELQYYYMGFYIHTCPKMRYKANYSPSSLLCPETYTWHPVEKCQPKLDVSKYCRLEEDPLVADADGDVIFNEVLVLSNHQAMPYFIYQAMYSTQRDCEETAQYAKLVGMKCARRMLLFKD